ncbi:uncharacterized protein TM35_000341130 [Trypanosoma theileri]|uniref:Uncharacterized protein n=1 Tax=Trypanosoma theileri TaxID=67003 RepID=A0A1X0NLQ7_9TRYP|nr:uncharacterized protein TM35_000341130 [Trypanosoma theileri]ORC85501.1 hypothetical protein TM35_000341130 [Trypanosoma theileri]
MEGLPVVSYSRVTDLAKSYRLRIAEDRYKTVLHNPLKVEECTEPVLAAEEDRRSTIERQEEEEISGIMRRWIKCSAFFTSEIHSMKEIEQKKVEVSRRQNILEKQIYREEFLRFWEKRKHQHHHRPVNLSKFFMIAYSYNILPFATDPVECWERGIVVPPELQQSVEISDSEGTVSLPPFHELSMRFREAYNHYRTQ